MDNEDIIEVRIGFDRNREEIAYIKSDFMDEDAGFKDPIGYTAQLIQMGLEKWIRDKVGITCPECDLEFKEGWSYCPNCGWNPDG
jgi:hypothetical protein